MNDSQSSPSLLAVSLVSVALHAALALGLQTGAQAARPPQHEPIRVTVRELPRPAVSTESAVTEQTPEAPRTPAASPVPPPSPRVASARHTARRAPATSTSPAPQESAPAAASALDFTGVTLTNPDGALAQAAGTGERREGPLGAAGGSGRGAGGAGLGQGKSAAQAAELVALGSLSRPPVAPQLDQALAANYPRAAHELGLAGEAVVRARILSDGQVGPTAVIVASSPEFGRACQRTLSGSRWSAPLDARGRPVATELRYKCVFEVTR